MDMKVENGLSRTGFGIDHHAIPGLSLTLVVSDAGADSQ
jgi:hypothetical protein